MKVEHLPQIAFLNFCFSEFIVITTTFVFEIFEIVFIFNVNILWQFVNIENIAVCPSWALEQIWCPT